MSVAFCHRKVVKSRFALAADTIEFQLGSKKEVRQLGHQLLGLLATSASVSVATRPPRSQPQLGRICSQITRGQEQQTERPA